MSCDGLLTEPLLRATGYALARLMTQATSFARDEAVRIAAAWMYDVFAGFAGGEVTMILSGTVRAKTRVIVFA